MNTFEPRHANFGQASGAIRGYTDSAGDEDTATLGGLFGTLRRGIWLIALSTLLTAAVAVFFIVTMTEPIYRAQAVVLLEEETAEVLDFDKMLDPWGATSTRINTEMQVMFSRGLARRVITELDLLSDPEFNPTLQVPEETSGVSEFLAEIGAWLDFSELKRFIVASLGIEPEPEPGESLVLTTAIDTLLGTISVTNVPDSNIVQISVVSTSPAKAALIANTLAKLYIVNQLEVNFQATDEAARWLGAQVADLKRDVEAAEQKLKDFNANIELVSPDTLAALNVQLKSLRERLISIEDENRNMESQIAAVEAATAMDGESLTAAIAGDPVLGDALRSAGISARTAEAVMPLLPVAATRLENNLRSNTRGAAAVKESIASLEERIRRQTDELVQQQELQRDLAATGNIYEYALNRLKQLSVQRGIQQANARVLSEAELPLVPSAPNKKLIVAVALVIGFMVGTALVLVRERGGLVFRTPEEVQQETGLQVAGEIPMIQSRAALRQVLSRRITPHSEAIRALRTSIQMGHGRTLPQVIMLSSSIPGEGKTLQSVALARSIASLGKRVLLVDADLRRRELTRILGLRKRTGLGSVLDGKANAADLAVRLDDLECDVMPGDMTESNPADMLASPVFASVLEQLKAAYDVIVIDTPPVLLVPDARLIGAVADAVYLLVRWDSTTRWQVLNSIRDFQSDQIQVDGIVMTQVDGRRMRRYGYGDRRGAYAYDRGYYGTQRA